MFVCVCECVCKCLSLCLNVLTNKSMYHFDPLFYEVTRTYPPSLESAFWAAAPNGSMTYAFTHMGIFFFLLDLGFWTDIWA